MEYWPGPQPKDTHKLDTTTNETQQDCTQIQGATNNVQGELILKDIANLFECGPCKKTCKLQKELSNKNFWSFLTHASLILLRDT
jgi:hypothetical protein